MFALICATFIAIPADAEGSYAKQQGENDTLLFACFDNAPEEDRNARLACQNVVLDACQARRSKPGGRHRVDCFLAEATSWSALMQREFTATFAEAEDGSDALTASQTAWDTFRKAQCGYAYAKWGSGSMRHIDSAICNRDMFAARTVFLWQERQPMPWPTEIGWD